MTTTQQKTIDELKEYYSKINSLEAAPSNIMEEIAAEINKATARKMKSEASTKAAYSMAFEAATKYADEVVRPIVSKFLNSFNVEVRNNGSIWVGTVGRYQTFRIESKFHKGKTTEFKQCIFVGFKMDYVNIDTTMDLHKFDDELKKFVIDTAKSVNQLYY